MLNVSVIQYPTAKELIDYCELSGIRFVSRGKYYTVTPKLKSGDLLIGRRAQRKILASAGLYGFYYRGGIHVWIGKASEEDVQRLIAHELSHYVLDSPYESEDLADLVAEIAVVSGTLARRLHVGSSVDGDRLLNPVVEVGTLHHQVHQGE